MVKAGTAEAAAIASYRNDHRFRRIVDSSAHQVMEEMRAALRAEDILLRDVHEAMVRTAAIALRMAFDGDVELHAAHIERDHYKKLAEQTLLTSSFPQVIVTKP